MNKAEKITMVDIWEIKPNPRNRNKHSDAQIARLISIMRVQGFRNPLIVSNQSGLVVAGHGRLMAAIKLGLEKVPVMFQDFDSEELEYAHMVADNAISLWAELDLAGINFDLPSLGPDLDLDLLGIKNFLLEPAEKEKKIHVCPHCGNHFS